MPKYIIEVDKEITCCKDCNFRKIKYPTAYTPPYSLCVILNEKVPFEELLDIPSDCPLQEVDDFGRLEHIKALYESTKERYIEQFQLQQNETDMEMWYIRNDILNDLRGQIKAYEVVLGW